MSGQTAYPRQTEAEALHRIATAYWQAGQLALADKAFAQAVAADPENAFILNAHGAFFLEQYRLTEAGPLLAKAYVLKPDNAEIANNLGLLSLHQHKLKEAENLFVKSIDLNPRGPDAYANLGRVLGKTKRFVLAERALRQALHLKPDHTMALGYLAQICVEQGRDEEGLAQIRKALSMAPKDPMLWLRLLDILERKSRLDEVAEALNQVKALSLAAPGFVLAELKLLRRRGQIKEAIEVVEKYIDNLKTAPPSPSIFAFFFGAGQLYDRQKETDKAFECFTIANRMQGEVEGLPQGQEQNRLSTLRPLTDYTPAQAKASCAIPADQRPSPVFLVGFPRSGTTLLDQILSSHPAIEVAEEKGVLPDCLARFVELHGADHHEEMLEIARKAGRPPWFLDNPCYPAALTELRTEDIAELRDLFYRGHAWPPQDPARRILIDKLPLNMLFAGFIRRIFPDAKIILALRHPCDAVLSCFMQQFRLNPYMARFRDIKDGAQFYDEAFGLWSHFNAVQDLGAHTVHYEDVVADFQPTIAKLLEFLGTDWNDAVLKYDETAKKRKVATPSYHQVTEKLYTRASGRWLRYRKHMEPVLDILAPHALKYGYSMEPIDEEK